MTDHDPTSPDPTPSDPISVSDRHDDDPLAARLRAALSSEAEMVNPADDGLDHIRDGIGAGTGHVSGGGSGRAGRTWWQHPAAPALAAASVLLLMAGGFALLGGGGGSPNDVTAGGTTPSSGSSGSSMFTQVPGTVSASGPPSAKATPALPIEGDVYVYYVHDDAGTPRLYRETRPNIGMAPAQMALTAMFTQPPNDPDYRSLWPQDTEVISYKTSGETATVDLTKVVTGPDEAVAAQQLVYSVTANDTSVKRVRLLLNGKTPPSAAFDWSTPITRQPMVDTQGLIWLLTPSEGSTVTSPVAVTGYGTAFEATISWEVSKAGTDGPVLAQGVTQAGANGEFGDFSATVDLQRGEYEIRAFEASAKDGSPIHVDSKTFTVE